VAELGFGEPEDIPLGLVFRASDAASAFNAQCMTFNGRKTALWQSPVEQHINLQYEPKSLQERED
jgi:hypothetical protein